MTNQTENAQTYVQLLVGSGLVNRAELSDFKKVAKDLNMPLIQAILNSGSIKKDDLNLVADALSKVQSKQVSPDLAIRALRIALKLSMPLADALHQAKNLHKTTRTFVSATTGLSNLLLDAQVITREQIGKLLVKSHESSIMIGQVMIIEGVVSAGGLLNALNTLLIMKESNLDKQDAIKALQHSYKNRVTIEQALFEIGKFVKPDITSIKIGELLLMANQISMEDYIECLEIELFKNKEFDSILMERGLIKAETLKSAKHLIESIKTEILKPYEASKVLKLMRAGETKIHNATHSILDKRQEVVNHKLGDLVVDAGLCSREELETALKANSDSAIKVGSTLIKSNLIEEKYLYFALRLQTSLRQGYTDRIAAIELLKYCKRSKLTLDEAFKELQVYIPSRMQWSWV